ncbi:hypothetical protein P9112_001705 [Eukaryota sp. TZLM1-RC]
MSSTLPNYVDDTSTELPSFKERQINQVTAKFQDPSDKQTLDKQCEYSTVVPPVLVSEGNGSSKRSFSLNSFILEALLTVILVLGAIYLLIDDPEVIDGGQVGTNNLIATLDNRFLAVDSLDTDTKIEAVEAALEPLLLDMDIEVNVEYDTDTEAFTFVYSQNSITLSNIKFYLNFDKRLDLAIQLFAKKHNSDGVIYLHNERSSIQSALPDYLPQWLDEANLLYSYIGTISLSVESLTLTNSYSEGNRWTFHEFDAEVRLSVMQEVRLTQLKILQSHEKFI